MSKQYPSNGVHNIDASKFMFIGLRVCVRLYRTAPANLDKRTTITIDDRTFVVEADDLEKICDLGHGAYGIVEKMRHRQTGTVMAVKRITATVNTQEQVDI